MISRFTSLLLALWLCGCGGGGFRVELLAEDGTDPSATEGIPWGEYADTLDVPDCPPGAVLTVNGTTDELDGGMTIAEPPLGGSLSLVEALFIAANRPGQDNIYFDPDVFPPGSPATILLSPDTPVPRLASPVCVDGRGRGVVVDSSERLSPTWDLGAGDLQVGLILRVRGPQIVAAAGRVAGCRFTTTGTNGGLFLQGGVAGPGNAFEGNGVSAYGGSVQESFFGFDPATRRILDGVGGVACVTDSVIERNVVVGGSYLLAGAGSMRCTFRDNLIGMDPSGNVQAVRGGGITIGAQSTDVVVGPGNVIRGGEWAIAIENDQPHTRITQNSISRNAHGIVYFDLDGSTWPSTPVPTVGPVAPPIILSATATGVSGRCDVAGTVELFSDPGDQGEQYIGSVSCAAGADWTLTASVPGGRNVTATLTDESGRTSAFSEPLPVP